MSLIVSVCHCFLGKALDACLHCNNCKEQYSLHCDPAVECKLSLMSATAARQPAERTKAVGFREPSQACAPSGSLADDLWETLEAGPSAIR